MLKMQWPQATKGIITGLIVVGSLTWAQNIDLCFPTAEIGHGYNLTGTFEINSSRVFEGIRWKGKDLSCAIDSICFGTDDHKGSRNYNVSTMTIISVSKSDAGVVQITVQYDPGEIDFDVCDMVVGSKPSCDISSSVKSDDLNLGRNVTLTVDLKGYHCSKPMAVSLTTENDIFPIIRNGTVEDSTDDIFNVTFPMTLERFGDVSMTMVCGETDWTLQCDGVQSLIMSPPKCNISSTSDTNNLDLHGNVTLTVDIANFYCPRSIEFVLWTGSDEEVLITNHTVENISDVNTDVDFTVTSSRLGNVNLTYTCDKRTVALLCDGVNILATRELTTPYKSTTINHVSSVTGTSGESTTSPPVSESISHNNEGLNIPLIAGSAAGGLLLIIIVILLIANRRKLKEVANIYFVSKREPSIRYMGGEIPEEYLPEEMKDAVAEDDIRLGSLEQKRASGSSNPTFSTTSDEQPYAKIVR